MERKQTALPMDFSSFFAKRAASAAPPSGFRFSCRIAISSVWYPTNKDMSNVRHTGKQTHSLVGTFNTHETANSPQRQTKMQKEAIYSSEPPSQLHARHSDQTSRQSSVKSYIIRKKLSARTSSKVCEKAHARCSLEETQRFP